MKEYKYLYRQMLDKEVIKTAYKNLRKGKTKRKEIQFIDDHLDEEVEKMRLMIVNTKPPDVKVDNPEKAYRLRKRKPKIIVEHGKRRKIYMPEIHEQWLHHMIIVVLQPVIMATAYKFSCGSFPKRGAHYGKRQLSRWIRSGKGIRYFGKIDIRHFYDNIQLKILLRELRIRIKDEWFLYVIALCLKGFKKGIPLGFYISQWLANCLLEPLDRFITEKLGLKIYVRYMDDMVFFNNNKKKLHLAIRAIKKFIGCRFRLKLKRTYQVIRFDFVKKDGKTIGAPLDFMGFKFFRDRTTIRKRIMIAATRIAKKLYKAKQAGRGYFAKHLKAMLSYMGWFSVSDTYRCYEDRIKPLVKIGRLKKIISKSDRRQNNETVDNRTLRNGAGEAAAYCT